jgi:uroporphyrinogen decarboxylase
LFKHLCIYFFNSQLRINFTGCNAKHVDSLLPKGKNKGDKMTVRQELEDLSQKIRERISAEPLSPLERLKILAGYSEPDRATGSFGFWTPGAVGIEDISNREFYMDIAKLYLCKLRAMDRFGHDYFVLQQDNYNAEPEALGAKMAFPENDTPHIVEPVLKNKKDLAKLKKPDPYRDGRLPQRIEMCYLHRETLGDVLPTMTNINTPFSMAVGLRGYQNIVNDVYEDPDFVHSLLEFCLEIILDLGNAIYQKAGIFPSLSDAWSSIPHLSPELFQEFSYPYTTRCIQSFGRTGWSFGGGHQFYDDWRQSLRKLLATGCRGLTLFEENISELRAAPTVDLAEAKQIYKSKGVFMNTAMHPETLIKGPVKKINELVKEWFSIVGPSGGHGFYTSVLAGTPSEHVSAFVEAIKSCRYPIGS